MPNAHESNELCALFISNGADWKPFDAIAPIPTEITAGEAEPDCAVVEFLKRCGTPTIAVLPSVIERRLLTLTVFS